MHGFQLSGQDPNGTDDITGVKTARDLDNADDYMQQTIAMLRDQQQAGCHSLATNKAR
ncbi:MAG TPA: hypothetical protein VN939_10100 [Chthoniobacterales bacterium]|jgi:hypothetical protein|nr:hypothetical protein [Chthoniobacterales bacterium]